MNLINRHSICEAYDSISPDSAAKVRMLENILSAAAEQPQPVRKTHVGIRRAAVIAAAVVLCLALAAAAYATGFFGLLNISLGKTVVGADQEFLDANRNEDGSLPPHLNERREVDIISMQGLENSPAYLASMEYNEFLDSYDQDGAIIKAVGNGPEGIFPKYSEYICYTQEMADKIDEICEKYGLALHEESTVAMSIEETLSLAGVGDVCGGTGKGEGTVAFGGYAYPDGTFAFEGVAVLSPESGAEWPYPIDYQFRRTMKNVFDTTALNVEHIEDYDQWEYTAKNGVTLLLAIRNGQALVIADRPESFVLINVINPSAGDIIYGEMLMERQDLEAFAETFDFSVID